MLKAPSKTATGRTGGTDETAEHRALRLDGRLPPVTPANAAVAAIVLAGIVLRFWARSHLWLDEALSVNIARLPFSEIPSALLRDGAPPLYYFLLHFWMKVFGTGDFAVRSLSGIFSVATLPAVWIAGRQLGGKKVAVFATILLSTSPFAIRYATETRMYSLVVLLVAWGLLALWKTLEDPAPLPAAGVALCTAALALTHYWSLYLFFVLGSSLAYLVVTRRGPRGTRTALAAMAMGGVLWLPWASSFLYQSQHTGTPWGASPPFGSLFTTVTFWAGGPLRVGPLLGLLFTALVALAVFGRAREDGRIELGGPPRRAAGVLAGVTFATLAVAYVAGVLTNSTFADRYTSVVFPLFILVAAIGVGVISSPRARNLVLAVVVACGLFNSLGNVGLVRTQAGRVARAIGQEGETGDVVAYCPDQLGPAVSRLLGKRFDQLVYPTGAGPRFVDWVDYEQRNKASDPVTFAHLLERRAPVAGSIWLVSSPGYKTFGRKCTILKEELAELRPTHETLVNRKSKASAWEREELTVFRTP